MSRHFIIDCDTAEDDVLSLISLLAHGISVHALTVVEGNIEYENEMKGALWALEYLRENGVQIGDLKVYPGARRLLSKDFRTAEFVHGETGLGEIEVNVKDYSLLAKEDASSEIIRLSKEYEGSLEFLAISPLTNLALAYLRDPEITKRIKTVYIMGGTIYARGNITPVAEFNFWVDPDAAKLVLNAGFNIVMVPWEVAVNNAIDMVSFMKLTSLKTKLSSLYAKMYSHYRKASMNMQRMRGNPHPDVITTAIAIDPSIAKVIKEENVDVETCDCQSRGLTIIDYIDPGHVITKKPNAKIVYDIDYEKFVQFLTKVLTWF
ncbi:nucleoside hydrolase [Candidatus Acidianus copahuensis]|uniref:Nucleoside hydrolase n=1 Tax=Candidatus Acidianus copahuensis TaxID=1160895 RepID=A0A031LVM8_9CREN|nr:nucleoside hydrolase [Candidatus Acidianus copahuensis]EZQ11529.1 nucleoside hydrolase [Candidatus Acidianus copahuensis]